MQYVTKRGHQFIKTWFHYKACYFTQLSALLYQLAILICCTAFLSRMLLLLSVLFGTQALCSWAASPPAGELPSVLLSPTCHDAAVEEAADLALRHINADRTEGYILSLYRILSVREHPQVSLLLVLHPFLSRRALYLSLFPTNGDLNCKIF